MQHTEQFGERYHLVDGITGVGKYKGAYEVEIGWTGFDDDDDTSWEPFSTIRDDQPGVFEDLLHTAGKRNLKRDIFDIFL